MWFKFCVLAVFSIYAAHAQSPTVHIEPFQSVFSKVVGSSLTVTCTSENSVKWSAEPPSAMTSGAVSVKGTSSGDNNISTLMLVDITKSNEGTFRCKDDSGRSFDQVSFELKVFNVTTESANFEFKVDTMLECLVQDEPSMTFTYQWSKEGTPVEDLPLETKQGYRTHPNGSLEIIHPARRLAGMYTCTAQYTLNQQTHNITVDVPYYATPKVLPFEKSKNLVQDEKLVIICYVLGYPKPNITWMKGGQVIEPGKDDHYTLSSFKAYDDMEIDHAQLEITSVDFDDGGTYECMARQDMWKDFNSTQPILVRVKDKLAALWPFLGIVAEVVILCTIIFIYEKKRNKDAMIEEDENRDGATEEKTSDSLRHRGNTNNPRA